MLVDFSAMPACERRGTKSDVVIDLTSPAWSICSDETINDETKRILEGETIVEARRARGRGILNFPDRESMGFDLSSPSI